MLLHLPTFQVEIDWLSLRIFPQERCFSKRMVPHLWWLHRASHGIVMKWSNEGLSVLIILYQDRNGMHLETKLGNFQIVFLHHLTSQQGNTKWSVISLAIQILTYFLVVQWRVLSLTNHPAYVDVNAALLFPHAECPTYDHNYDDLIFLLLIQLILQV